ISGISLVDISRGGRMRGRRLEPGEEIAARYSDFRRLFVNLPELATKVDLLMDRVNAFFNTQNQSLANRILANIPRLRSRFATEAPAVERLRVDAHDDVVQLNQAWAEFQQAGGNIDKLAAVAKAIDGEIQSLTSVFRGAATNVNGFVQENRRPVQDFWS